MFAQLGQALGERIDAFGGLRQTNGEQGAGNQPEGDAFNRFHRRNESGLFSAATIPQTA
ncbi:MAG TPA: hypothetical protein VEA63_14965 [Opitutus sp.]|nr:hypothetical protein [Opitutus sp.]